VSNIIKQNYERTKELINKHKDKLETMAKTLLAKEVLDHNDLKELLGDHPEGKYPEGIFGTDKSSEVSNGKEEYSEAEVADDEQDQRSEEH
jgi:cell division protease FtsH